MDTQIEQFGAMSDYLQQRDVRVAVVFLPQGTWDDKMPFARVYTDAISELCQRKAIQTMDWSMLLDDDDFADSNHINPAGVDKLQPLFLEMADDFLRSTGELK